MLALLIQSIYNVVDSYFVARYSQAGLTAVSIIYPIQLLMTAVGTGTGAGINILISRMDGTGETEKQHDIVRNGLWLGFFNALVFTVIGTLTLHGVRPNSHFWKVWSARYGNRRGGNRNRNRTMARYGCRTDWRYP